LFVVFTPGNGCIKRRTRQQGFVGRVHAVPDSSYTP
jgi:hypothetical protein